MTTPPQAIFGPFRLDPVNASLQHGNEPWGRRVVAERLPNAGDADLQNGLADWLNQDVWYQRVGVARRLQLHRRIGARAERGFETRAGEIAAELTVHFERGRDDQRAVRYLGHAAENATRRHAHREAIGHLTRGLELLGTLPDTPERARLELDFQTALGPALIATKGHAAPEVERAYARARALYQETGETPRLFPVLCGLRLFHLQRAELQTARQLGEELLDLARRADNPVLLVLAHQALGTPLFWLGELGQARDHLEEAVALYVPEQHHSHASLYGEDPGVSCLSYLARVLWALGYPEQALKRIDEALTLADGLAHPFSRAYALSAAAFVHQLRCEGAATQEWAEVAMRLSVEQGFRFILTWATILRGAALAEQGSGREGVTQLREGLAAHQATGGELGRPYLLTLLAKAHRGLGQAEDGLSVLAEAQALADKSGERACESERYRLQGELLLMRGGRRGAARAATERGGSAGTAQAESCFRHAIDVARRQRAKSWELRATMSLYRLRQQQGKAGEARGMLAAAYGSFGEGRDTPDLKAAKALLEDLGEHGHAAPPGGRRRGGKRP